MGSASGRSPRLTKESVRRRMEAKKLEQQQERDRAMGILDGGVLEWKPIEGLGIGMPSSTDAVDEQDRQARPPYQASSSSAPPLSAQLTEELPSAPTGSTHSAQPMSRLKGATTDVAPASIRTQHEERPSLRPRANTLSAQDILSTQSALQRLALGRSEMKLHDTAMEKEVLKEGSAKEVKVEPKRILSVQSSSPLEEAYLAPTSQSRRSPSVTNDTSSLSIQAADKAKRDAELMPPPPLPPSFDQPLRQPDSLLVSARSHSPTPSSHSSTSGNEGPRGREDAINARKREKRATGGGTFDAGAKEKKSRGRGRRSLSTGDSSLLEVRGLSACRAVIISG